ncbi:MAG: tol-pal system protein YbgF [Hyphomicrobiaceae bacterium]|nr:tol-pal system protein YbgF [Hyphomicrobiaceae bacterium]
MRHLFLALSMLAAFATTDAASAAKGGPAKGGSQPSAEVVRLRERVEQLEAQLVDMRVLIGTLQSLAQGGAARPSGGAPASTSGGGDAGRLSILETQIRALTAQVERLSDRVRALGGGRGGTAYVPRSSRQTFGSTPNAPGWSTTDNGDRIGNLIERNGVRPSIPPQGAPPAPAPSAAAPGQQAAQAAYEDAYGYWLQRNYQAAQKSFTQFLADHPKHRLAGHAQYWLGETFFALGKYNEAAQAFLKGYQAYGSGTMAPDSLLRLAMSLDKLGHRKAACSSLGELKQRFPQAPRGVMRRLAQQKQRLGC